MRRILAALVLGLALTGCGELLEPAAAVVYEEKITVDEVNAQLDAIVSSAQFEAAAQTQDPSALKRGLEQEILTQLIRREVIEPAAADLGIEIDDDELAARMDEIKADFPSESAFEETLKEQGLSLERLEELVYDDLLEQEVRAEVTEGIDPDEADAHWDSYLRELYEEANVRVNPRYGEFDDEALVVIDASAADIPGVRVPGEAEPAPSPSP